VRSLGLALGRRFLECGGVIIGVSNDTDGPCFEGYRI
jgi:hypothetical protein